MLLDSPALLQCFADVLDDVMESNFALLDCVIIQRPSAPPATRASRFGRRLWRRLAARAQRRRILFDLYDRWDAAHRPSDDPLREVDYSSRLLGVYTIEVEARAKGFVDMFPDSVIQEIRARELDVLLRFGFNIIRGEILTAAKHGVWSFHHRDTDFYRGGPALFWEMYEQNPLSGVILQVLTEKLDAGRVLCKSLFATQSTMSLVENRYGPYKATTHFVIRKLNELHRLGVAALESRAVPEAPYQGRRRLYRTPTNAEMGRWLGRRLYGRLKRTVTSATTKSWRVALRNRGPFLDEAVIAGSQPIMTGFDWLEAPAGRFYADPFLTRKNGCTWLFVEEFDRPRSKGRISVAKLGEPKGTLTFEPCLELPEHLSFPFLLEDQGEIFLVPESADAGQVVLYRADRFPFGWKPEKVLLTGSYVDTVLWNDQRWWLLTTIREPRSCAVHSLLFHADSLWGSWTLHPASPLFNDVRHARNAGPVFAKDGKWYRISQDCSVEYGHAFRFNAITALNGDVYCERPLASITPWLPEPMIGTHTYNRCAEWEAVDGCFREPLRRSARSS